MNRNIIIRNAQAEEFEEIGNLMVRVYSNLQGFPNPSEQPAYYNMLANIGELTKKPHTELLVVLTENNKLAGGVVYFSDMAQYGSGGSATQEKNASGFRLLAVETEFRGEGIAKQLTQYCIDKTKQDNNGQLIIHTTKAMQIAWNMYEKLGFKRSVDLDFMQGKLQVYGFRMKF